MQRFGVFWIFQKFSKKISKGVYCVDLGESFHMSMYLQTLASIQPRAYEVCPLSVYIQIPQVLTRKAKEDVRKLSADWIARPSRIARPRLQQASFSHS